MAHWLCQSREMESAKFHKRNLYHGTIRHGFQYLAPEKRGWATTYYGESSGVGLAINNHPRRGEGLSLGVVGLGIGTIAAYANRSVGRQNSSQSDRIVFYEINPEVITISEGVVCTSLPATPYLVVG